MLRSLPRRLIGRAVKPFLPVPPLAVRTYGPHAILYRPGTSDEQEARYTLSGDPYLPHLEEYDLCPGDVVLDIGACIGGFALTCAVGGAKVYAIEASQDTFRVMDATIALNGLRDRVTTSRLALADRRGTLTLYHADEARGNSLSSQGQAVHGAETVPSCTLVDYLADQQIDYVHLAKLNCEGAEWGILMPTPVDVLRKVGCFVICVHEDLMPGRSADELEGHLQAAGCQTRRVPDPGGSPHRPVLVAWR